MAELVNYYEEFGLPEKGSLKEIKKQLIQQERVWHSRQHIRPEEARKKLVLIDEAKKCFETEKSRALYEERLAKGTRKKKRLMGNVKLVLTSG